MNAREIQLIHVVSADNTPWRHDALLVWVPKGTGALQWKRYENSDSDDPVYGLMLRNKPIVNWHDLNGCPTCDQLLAAGYGLTQTDHEMLDSVRRLCNSNWDEMDATFFLQQFGPILNLLKPGLYLIGLVPHCPTDGEGNFFWDVSEHERVFLACHWNTFTMPWFLTASQPPTKYDDACTKRYLATIESCSRVPYGIAFNLMNSMSILLDGHHRATAALLCGQQFECITIMGIDSVGPVHEDGSFEGFSTGGIRLSSEVLPELVKSSMRRNFGQPWPTVDFTQTAPLEGESNRFHRRLLEFQEKATQYPTASQLMAIEIAGDLSEDRIAEMLQGEIDINELFPVFNALTALHDDKKALEIAKWVIKNKVRELWLEVFTYLAGLPRIQVEDLFIEYLVNDDHSRPDITAIIDNYFEGKEDGSERPRE